ncbi:MAG: hypothetical protein U9N86_17425 [Bacteroidota bacterium]|nr:hypothetical protein [Bacteroidota bacterium]
MDNKRISTAQKLLDTAQDFWDACHEEGQQGAVQWLEGTGNELLIYTRSEYRETLMANINKLPRSKVHYFKGDVMPQDDDV